MQQENKKRCVKIKKSMQNRKGKTRSYTLRKICCKIKELQQAMQHERAENRKPGKKKAHTDCIKIKRRKMLQVYFDKQHFRHNNSIPSHFLSSFIHEVSAIFIMSVALCSKTYCNFQLSSTNGILE